MRNRWLGASFSASLRHLQGQFAGRRHDEADRPLELVRPPAVEERQHERGGLAGAGLGLADDVLARERGRNDGFLDRRRVGVAA